MFLSLLCIIHTAPPWLLLTLVEKSFVSRFFDTKKSHEIFHVPDCHLTPLIWWNWSKIKYYKTSKYPNSIKSFFFKLFLSLSTSKTFPKSMTMKSIQAKANTMVLDQKTIFNGLHSFEIYFYFGTISMFSNLKATISHEFQYLNYSKH